MRRRGEFLVRDLATGHLDAPGATPKAGLLIRALALLDRLPGKRRLRELTFPSTEHPLVEQFFDLRRSAEGLRTSRLA